MIVAGVGRWIQDDTKAQITGSICDEILLQDFQVRRPKSIV